MLTTLDEIIADMGGPLPGTVAHQLQQVRDAVAELIEAAEYMAQYASSYSALTYSPTACAEANDRLRVALANVTGGAE